MVGRGSLYVFVFLFFACTLSQHVAPLLCNVEINDEEVVRICHAWLVQQPDKKRRHPEHSKPKHTHFTARQAASPAIEATPTRRPLPYLQSINS
jgi:hypothetical protein